MLPKFYFVTLFFAIFNDKIKILCLIFIDFLTFFLTKKQKVLDKNKPY